MSATPYVPAQDPPRWWERWLTHPGCTWVAVCAFGIIADLLTQTGNGTDGRRHSRTLSSGSWSNWKVV